MVSGRIGGCRRKAAIVSQPAPRSTAEESHQLHALQCGWREGVQREGQVLCRSEPQPWNAGPKPVPVASTVAGR